MNKPITLTEEEAQTLRYGLLALRGFSPLPEAVRSTERIARAMRKLPVSRRQESGDRSQEGEEIKTIQKPKALE